MVKPKSPVRTVFLAAPGRISLIPIRDELRKRGVEAFSAYESSKLGAPIQEQIESSIRKADLVLAVIDTDPSPNVFFELGLAKGLRKQVFLIISPNYGQLPTDLADEIYVRAEPWNREAISFALDQIWEAAWKKTPRRTKPEKVERPLGDAVDDYQRQINERGNDLTGYELERIVVDILKASGVATIKEGSRDQDVDIAVWSDDLQPILGNPLLIEVKSNIRDETQLRNAIDQVERFRQHSDTRWALLIAARLPEVLNEDTTYKPVFVLTISQLLDKLRYSSFSEAVRDLRNQRMHGGAL